MGKTLNNQVDRSAQSFDISRYVLWAPSTGMTGMSGIITVEGRKLCMGPAEGAHITKADAATGGTEYPNY